MKNTFNFFFILFSLLPITILASCGTDDPEPVINATPTVIASGQDCEFKVNEANTKETTSQKVFNTNFFSGEFGVKKVNTSYFLVFNYIISSHYTFEPYCINSGANIIFSLENGEKITLTTMDNVNGVAKTVPGQSIILCCIENVSYPVSSQQIDSLLKSNVVSVRVYRSETDGKKSFEDFEIKSKNQDDVQQLLSCVL